ncbi:MAG TPA: hypothetical protein VNY07_07710 [Chthoniobacterales bacterium]|nr:hypothetical protein [Chthoniobacterales bacterium]
MTARRKALAGIKAAGEAGDWRAVETFLLMSFAADYRRRREHQCNCDGDLTVGNRSL